MFTHTQKTLVLAFTSIAFLATEAAQPIQVMPGKSRVTRFAAAGAESVLSCVAVGDAAWLGESGCAEPHPINVRPRVRAQPRDRFGFQFMGCSWNGER